MSAPDYRISLSTVWYDLHLLYTTSKPSQVFILMISIMGVNQKASGVLLMLLYFNIDIYSLEMCWNCFGNLMVFFTYLSVIVYISFTFILLLHYCRQFCYQFYVLMKFLCQQVYLYVSYGRDAHLEWSQLNAICFLSSSENKGTRCINVLGGGVYYNVWIFVYMSVYAILYIPCPYFKIIYWYLITLLFWHVWVYLIWQPLFELIVVLTMDLYDFAGSCVNWVIKWTIAYHIDPWPGNKRRH